MFQKARLKLTAWYLLIIMAISLMFSSAIYQSAVMEFTRFERMQRFRIEQRLEEDQNGNPRDTFKHFTIALPPSPELIEEVKQRILWILFILNVSILTVAGIVGYFLAGKTLRPIKEMIEEQHRFISDASHELKTPLTSLKSAMEVYLRDKSPKVSEAKLLIKESIEEVNKLQSLSESLLQLAQYENSNGSMKVEQVLVKKILEDAIRKIEPLAQKKEIIINSSYDESIIEGNMYALIDLFIILLDNAIKYSPVKSTVVVTAKKSDGYVLISIQDQGQGIHKKDVPHLFERFYRADIARSKQETNGYGLGLSIGKKIVDAHHGSITVASAPKKGSTFTVKLPVTHSSPSKFFR